MSRSAWIMLPGVLMFACSDKGVAPASPEPGPDSGSVPDDDGSSSLPDDGQAADSGSLLSAVSDRFPPADASGVCADAALRLTFTSPVGLGQAGKIQVFKASQPDVPIDTIDMSVTSFLDPIAGRNFFHGRPVLVEPDGLHAAIYFRLHVLLPDETYFVTIDAGVFLDPSTNPLGGISGASAWRFSTKAAAPASPDSLLVAADGSGDFCTVQGAIDSLPAPNASPVVITVKSGIYHEIVLITKSNITLRGEDRKSTVIAYANNNTLQIPPGATASLGTKFRSMVGAENVSGLVIENLTMHNLTPQNGSQAEALRVEGGDKVILRNADFVSLQDTLLLSGTVYAESCYVEGNVDYIWGKGAVYFNQCEIRTVGRQGYNVQARNPAATYGYVFVDSKITSAPGITGHMLARIDATAGTGYPASHVAYINCQLGPHIDPTGWLVTGDTSNIAGLRFWEYQSTDLSGLAIDVSRRNPVSRQITAAEAVQMRDKTVVLAGWNPTP